MFVEIHESAKPHRLITVVEIISPSNKRPGGDRGSYLSLKGYPERKPHIRRDLRANLLVSRIIMFAIIDR